MCYVTYEVLFALLTLIVAIIALCYEVFRDRDE